jgi:hypothetical protein
MRSSFSDLRQQVFIVGPCIFEKGDSTNSGKARALLEIRNMG